MRNKKDSGTLIIIILVIVLIILGGLLVYTHLSYKVNKEDFKDFMVFQVEYTQYITEKCGLNYSEELDNFLKYKVNKILNETNININTTTEEIE